MHVKGLAVVLGLASLPCKATPLVSSPGDTAVIPSWDLVSSAKVGNDLSALSQAGLDTSSWHHVGTSRCTLMGCLIEAGVYNEDELFYSENLRKVDARQFSVPWIYRREFDLKPRAGSHFFLQTHGISSRADIFLNGQRVASSADQAGSYVGKAYDITHLVRNRNALVIQVHPTDYYRDLAIGWIDWNPWPADNGTGIWRDIEIRQTGAVRLEPLRAVTQLSKSLDAEPAAVTLKARAHNVEDSQLTVTATACVVPEEGGEAITWAQTFTLAPGSSTDLSLTTTIPKPRIWWPRQWGSQPLYNATLSIAVSSSPSDISTTTFGLRTITRTFTPDNSTLFHINHRPFQVLGAGYAPNMFLRTSHRHWYQTLAYAAAMGLNTLRLEGKLEHPGFYTLADRAGIMLLPGWECCNKWEAFPYNDHLPPEVLQIGEWTDADYDISRESMRHEAGMMQNHPSVLAFVIGSDFSPDERATTGYVEALREVGWQTPVIASASTGRGFVSDELTGPGGMKMDGPYEWVPPTYWWDNEGEGRLGAAFGFASELGAGVGTPELASLRRFLNESEIEDLWRRPNKTLFHMSREGSEFTTREVYNAALWKRWGPPKGRDDYLVKAQLMDYEATRAQFEAYLAMWSDEERPATGLVYWMLNSAWPSLHWQLWDYYMRPAGAFFGVQTAARIEHVAFDYVRGDVWLINRSLEGSGRRRVEVEVMDVHGRTHYRDVLAAETVPNKSMKIGSLAEVLANVTRHQDAVFLRLVLCDGETDGAMLSRNVYWVSRQTDVLDWNQSEWFVTPVSQYADYTSLNQLGPASVEVRGVRRAGDTVKVVLDNKAKIPAFFVSVTLVNEDGDEVLPVIWDDNYVTLWPKERYVLTARRVGKKRWKPAGLVVRGKNVETQRVKLD
ncbi:hypothetical protein VTJ49DRAFT_6259 [Mycothermus thermophilus]|uniref:Exo-1,4-beta-D-glucosaminidase n=1 Tax=Humicola insolens TaxID=85995 RepID=A0ABR3V1M9_HUMIN